MRFLCISNARRLTLRPPGKLPSVWQPVYMHSNMVFQIRLSSKSIVASSLIDFSFSNTTPEMGKLS